MYAAWYEKNGTAVDVLQLGELETPRALGAGEVLVKLSFSGVNPSDVKTRAARPLTGEKVVPHSDGAGLIEAVGEGVPSQRVGERVWIWNGQWKRAFGTAAQYIALPSEQAVFLPEPIELMAGACFGIPLLTAWHALSFLGDINGKSLLVTGAASNVGYYVTQIATKAYGAKVFGTVGSSIKAEHAKSAGAAVTIDYKNEDVAESLLELTQGKGVDGVVDMDFSTTAPLASTGCIANHSSIVTYGSNTAGEVCFPYREFMFRCLSIRQFAIYEITEKQRDAALKGVSELLASNFLQHSIAKTFKLQDVVAAHEAVEAGNNGAVGNIVLEI